MSNLKVSYIKPEVKIELISLEHSIAASSANLKPGGPNGSNNPEIEDWKVDKGSQPSDGVDIWF